jgi:alkanesulfonate monooxygenase SsuD/methylene tetrahydromethanopterin reductase-like flavin-dependent oxidoreductase (luciferase family)
MKVGVMVTSYNSNDWDRLLAGDYSRGPEVADRDIVDNTLLFGKEVEPLGFDSIWTAEHYGSPYSMQGNPLQWLSYWAARTERVDMGSAVLVLPWWDPVKLATEMAMLDLLLEGRRFLPGVGRGVAFSEYGSLRIPPEESRERFYEVLDIIKLADQQEEFSYDGQYYKIPSTVIRPQARHKGQLLDDVRGAFTTRKSAELASRAGLGQMFVAGEPLERMAKHFGRFNEARIAQGLEPDQPTAMLFTRCVPNGTDADEAKRYFLRQMEDSTNHYAVWKHPGFEGVKGYEDYVPKEGSTTDFGSQRIAEQVETQLIGTPDEIIEKVIRVQEAISMNRLIIHINHGAIPIKDSLDSLRLFAKEVLPVLHEMETPLHRISLGAAADTVA